ncbi:MAG: glycerophosphodiester phosphodiesterase [Solirubrobacteraceae bacterium]|nr:glycerophosphodiester phosphodiesterase [Solirubrobacteraceae bacterium]
MAARGAGRTLRIGHKGCAAVVPGNTLAGIEHAVVELGVDAVEFDVLPDGAGGLRLAHDPADLAARPDAPTVEQALERLARPDLAGVGVNIDVKVPGDEARIVAMLRDHGLVERALVSTMETETLRAMRGIAPEVRLGWSIPRVNRDWTAHPLTRPAALGALLAARRVLPRLAVRALRSGRVDAIMAHHALVTPAFARTVTAHGELHVWTVDDADLARRLVGMGVTGVTSNDPRLVP